MPNSGIFSSLQKFIQHFGEQPTGAFPSTHIAISWLILFLIKKYYKNKAAFLLPFIILLSFSTVYIKAHYFIDIIGDFIIVPIYFILANYFYNYSSKRKEVIEHSKALIINTIEYVKQKNIFTK